MKKYYELAERLLREMVAIPTVNGNEQALAEYIAGVLEPYGFRTELQPIADKRANICAAYGCSENRVIFTGHLDVVPTGDNWEIGDPFAVQKKGSRFYGRGTCDMKGGIACMMASAIRAIELDEVKNCELCLLFVVDEEVDGLGSKYYVEHEAPTKKTIAVIGEPTMLEACIAHRGVNRFRIHIYGKQCHSGIPQEGINAIYQAARFLLEIEKLDQSRQSMDCGILPPPNVTATIAHSGIKENAVPGMAEVILDCRTVPGETVETLQADILNILRKLFDGTPVTYDISDFITVTPAGTDADGRVCTIFKNAYRQAFGTEGVTTYFKGSCDMSYFCKAGYKQTLLCGPGSMDQAHIVDEYIEEEQLHRAVNLYSEIIRQAQPDEP